MDKINYGEVLSSEDLGNKFNELQTLVAQAYMANQDLRNQLRVQQIALETIGASVDGAAAKAGQFLNSVGFQYDGDGNRKLAHFTFWDPITTSNGLYIEPKTGSILLSHKSDISRIPRINGEVSAMASVVMGSELNADPAIRWILDDNKFWAGKSAQNEINIHISLPPTLRSDINYISIKTLFPHGNTYRVTYYDTYGNANHSTKGLLDRSRIFPVNGTKFGGKITITMRSSLTDDDGNYIFGLRSINAGYREFTESGWVICPVAIDNPAGATVLRSFSANWYSQIAPLRYSDVVRFQIGTGYSGNDITGLVYDSISNEFPLLSTDSGISIGTINQTTLYVKCYLYNNGSSPVLNGFYFEYEA